MTTLRTAVLSLLLANWAGQFANADPLLADFDYPHPVQRFDFQSQGQFLTMAYMDAQPTQPNGRALGFRFL